VLTLLHVRTAAMRRLLLAIFLNFHMITGQQVLMKKCPKSFRCVSRKYCDSDGLLSRRKINKLSFNDDTRGLINCVNSKKNRLGVCCLERSAVLSKLRKRPRQDELGNEILKLDKIRSNQDDNVFINENLLSDLFDTSEESKDTQENILDELDALGEMIASIPDTELEKKLKDNSEDPVVIINIRGDEVDLEERIRSSRVRINDEEDDLLKDLEATIASMLDAGDVGVENDHLDFDTDVLAITMDSELPRVPRNYHLFQRNTRRRPYFQHQQFYHQRVPRPSRYNHYYPY